MPSFEIKPIDLAVTPKWSAASRSYWFQLGEIAELAVVLGVWIYLFRAFKTLGGYTEAEIVTYIIAGSVLGVTAEWLEESMIEADIDGIKGTAFVDHPFRYFAAMFRRGWYQALLPFFTDIAVNVAFIMYFHERLVFSFKPLAFVAIAILLVLAFVVEFLIIYWFRLSLFWWSNTPAKREFFDRIKKILSGVYFPLDLLPAFFLKVSLFLPFAYAFFVPAQLYLGKASWGTVILGIFIQLAWIMIIFQVIRKKVKKMAVSA